MKGFGGSIPPPTFTEKKEREVKIVYKDKIEKTIESLKLAVEMSKEFYGKPLIITYSGGKDSDVLLDIARKCLKPYEFEVLNSHTSVDAPETVYHIREVFDEVRRGVQSVQYISPKTRMANRLLCGI